jgi:hypothetical protein
MESSLPLDTLSINDPPLGQIKVRFLWHNLYDNVGPLVGVAEGMYPSEPERKSERFVFNRNNEGKYDFRKIKEGSWEGILENHEEYRRNNGGHTDHDPALYAPRKFRADMLKVVVTPLYDYRSNCEENIFITLSKEEIGQFYPPRSIPTPKPLDTKEAQGTSVTSVDQSVEETSVKEPKGKEKMN